MDELLNHIELYIVGGLISGVIGMYFYFIKKRINQNEARESVQDNRLVNLERKQAILEAKLLDKDDFFEFANQLKDSLSEKIDGYKKDHEKRLDEFLTIQDKKFQNLDYKIDSIRHDINRGG